MNYAASLAVVAVLTFFFPLAVRIGLYYDVPRSLVAITMLSVVTFVATTWAIRWQVVRYRHSTARLERARAQVGKDPLNSRAYFVEDEHLAALLLRLGRRREAAEVIDRYARLSGARESEIVSLRELQAQAERRRNRGG